MKLGRMPRLLPGKRLCTWFDLPVLGANPRLCSRGSEFCSSWIRKQAGPEPGRDFTTSCSTSELVNVINISSLRLLSPMLTAVSAARGDKLRLRRLAIDPPEASSASSSLTAAR